MGKQPRQERQQSTGVRPEMKILTAGVRTPMTPRQRRIPGVRPLSLTGEIRCQFIINCTHRLLPVIPLRIAVKKKLQVFVSSTYTDMLVERQAAVEAILRAGHIRLVWNFSLLGMSLSWSYTPLDR